MMNLLRNKFQGIETPLCALIEFCGSLYIAYNIFEQNLSTLK